MHYYDGAVHWRYNKWVLRLDQFLKQVVAQMVVVKNAARIAQPQHAVTPPEEPLSRPSRPAPSPKPTAEGTEAVPSEPDAQPSALIDSETENPESDTEPVGNSPADSND